MSDSNKNFPPQGYASLKALSPGSSTKIIAVVASSKPPKRTRQGEHMITCFLADTTLAPGVEVMTNLFRKKADFIPNLKAGSLIELRGAKVQIFNGRTQILAACNSFLIIHEEDITCEHKALPPLIRDYANVLKQWWITKSTCHVPETIQAPLINKAAPTDIPNYVPTQKFRSFQSARAGIFIDIAVEVVVVASQSSRLTEIVVTDYTENKAAKPSSRQIEEGLGASGRRIDFTVTLWDEHASSRYILGVKKGARLLLLNCKVKLSPLGIIELSMHGEKRDVSKNIYPLAESLSHELSTRKASLIQELKDLKEPQDGLPSMTRLTCIDFPEAPLCDVEQILECTNVPNHYRTKGRITEVWPGNDDSGISAFCRRVCTDCEAPAAADLTGCQAGCNSSFSWIYQFAFKLAPLNQDSPTLPVLVSHQDAVICSVHL
ncbi:hypothetical protein DSO57_1030364 [Entomophthora muscae]|uniref:Uncharacterized protein n=1 Tax=Entomophthora muscae TaxID=34485 RepID=A0ACC2TZQ0_9FUNG|nr:hypothetical protein DSO57_1030364 [Entomophthora muscae]